MPHSSWGNNNHMLPFTWIRPLLEWTHVYRFRSIQLLSHVQLFVTPWNAARQASLSITNSWSLHKLMSIESVMPSNISCSVVTFSSCLQSFPGSGSFSVGQFFTSGGQTTAASPSVLSMNIQGWFQMVKNPPAVQKTWVWSLGQEDPLEKGRTTHSNILA